MMGRLRGWWRERAAARHAPDEALWEEVVQALPALDGLEGAELVRLRALVAGFLSEKEIVAPGGGPVEEALRLGIAAQACLLVLNLGLEYYRGWVSVVVYPDEFITDFEYVDEAGVVHAVRHPRVGESWPTGPVILSGADVFSTLERDGMNVVLHEFAHKLDMANGDVNGFPPLHRDMSREAWSAAFTAAYEDFRTRVERGEETWLDPYGAEAPGEFFAVLTETFFEAPWEVREPYPEVYAQLAAFYRQDPLPRLERAWNTPS